MNLTDTHCHLTSSALADQADAVIDRAIAAGVRRLITVGTDLADSQAALALARRRSELRMTAGIHPHEAAKASPTDVEALATIWAEPVCVGAGEIGLDYHYDFSPRAVQQDLFARQLDAAAAAELPVVVHSREAFDDTIRILERCGLARRRVVFHCFGGSADEAAAVAERGWRISLTGVVTFKRSTELQAIAAALPADGLLLETDAPYLSPEPVRHVRPNEPANLVHTARFLAKLRGETVQSIAEASTANAAAFFRWPLA
ncbi:MAG: TatD family hydrolase [Phycisphaerae bacterium]|nr:TatD family hydrolase [Phycisphaerae bacterium]